jgi:CTP:molybdopterin cytidylyltransferase MocA
VRTGGIVLAAGAGRRFGGAKQLAPFEGRTLVEHAVAAQCEVDELDPVVVVLGAYADAVLDRADLGRARAVVCQDWATGMAASLRDGLEALGHGPALVTLADQPGVGAAAIRRVLAAGAPARAAYDGVPGHPVLLDPELAAAARDLSGDEGARSLLGAAPLVECGDLGDPRDVDTRQDLEAVRS